MSLVGDDSILMGAAGGAGTVDIGDNIPFACRFNIDDSAVLSRTLGAGTSGVWTYSTWVKRSLITSGFQTLLSADAVTNPYFLAFQADDTLRFVRASGASPTFTTTAKWRDPNAWLHVMLVVDTGEATADIWKIFVNGVRQAGTLGGTPGATTVNTAVLHTIGKYTAAASNYLDGYLSQIYFIDGIALTPASFGRTSADSGQWVPINYTGAYGTEGFYLDLSNSSNFGEDQSGNNNDFTGSGLATNDQVTDTPTSNYCTLNPIDKDSHTVTYSDGNKTALWGANAWGESRGTFSIPKSATGKFYVEFKMDVNSGPQLNVGIKGSDEPAAGINGINWRTNGTVYDGNGGTSTETAYTTGDVIGLEFDMDNDVVKGYKNSASVVDWTLTDKMAGGNEMDGDSIVVRVRNYSTGEKVTMRTDPVDWEYQPSGTIPWNTANLPTPVITNPALYVKPYIYTGTGAELVISDLGFSPDLVWIKNRGTTDQQNWVDTARGATLELNSDSTADESTVAQGVKSFDANGITLGTDLEYNTVSENYEALFFQKGVTPGFDIVTYTGAAGSGSAISHSLGVVPEFITVKARTTAGPNIDWFTYHANNTAAPETDHLLLSDTAATVDDLNSWDDTAPTTTVFTVGGTGGSGGGNIDVSGDIYVAYLWASVAGFSKIGIYQGNTNADGTFVCCDFKPAIVLVKTNARAQNWVLWQSAKEPYNPKSLENNVDAAVAEGANAPAIDFLSNGFKLRTAATAVNGTDILYMAFAEAPFKYARGA
jgi:hypothetical protein